MTVPWVDDGINQVTCTGCSATFPNVGEMIQHAQIAHGIDVD